MATIREINGNHYVRFRDSTRKPAEKTVPIDASLYPTERDRELYRMELEVAYAKGTFDPWGGEDDGAVRTVREAVDAYVEHKKAAGERGERRGWNANTADNYEDLLHKFARHAGPQRAPEDLTTSDLALFIHRKGLAEATRRMYRRALRTMVRWWNAEGITEGLKVPPALTHVRRLPEYITEAELETICEAHVQVIEEETAKKHVPKSGLKSPRSKLYFTDVFRFAFYQGLRLGEVAALRVGAVSPSRGLLQVGDQSFVTKGKSEDVIPLVPPARPVIAPYLEGRARTEHVFRRKTGKRFSDSFRKARKKAFPDRKGVHFHSLRHSCAIYWLERGANLRDVRDLLRHKSITTTERYEQAVQSGLRQRFEELGDDPAQDAENGD